MTTAGRLRELFVYDSDTGLFTRRVARSNSPTGAVAGTVNERGYRYITIDRRNFLAHRLAWLYIHGSWPPNQIDHVNGIKDDNRISNLREATDGENLQNQRRAQRHNKSGLLGVSVAAENRRKRYRATIALNRRQEFIGYFDTKEAAHAAYLAAKDRLHSFSTIRMKP